MARHAKHFEFDERVMKSINLSWLPYDDDI